MGERAKRGKEKREGTVKRTKGKERGQRRLPRENAEDENKRVVRKRIRRRELAEVRQKRRLEGKGEERERASDRERGRKRERGRAGRCW